MKKIRVTIAIILAVIVCIIRIIVFIEDKTEVKNEVKNEVTSNSTNELNYYLEDDELAGDINQYTLDSEEESDNVQKNISNY